MSAAEAEPIGRGPTVPIRIALRAAQKGDWERAEGALLESLSAVRKADHDERRGGGDSK